MCVCVRVCVCVCVWFKGLYLYVEAPGPPVSSDCPLRCRCHCGVSLPQEKGSDWGLHCTLCYWLLACSAYNCSTWKISKEASEYFITKSVFISNLKISAPLFLLPPLFKQTCPTQTHPIGLARNGDVGPLKQAMIWKHQDIHTLNEQKLVKVTPSSYDFNILWALCPTTSICVCSAICLIWIFIYIVIRQ